MFGDIHTITDDVNKSATAIEWCGLPPFITGGIISLLAGGVGCLAGCMLRDKRNQETWNELGQDVWEHYKVIKEDGKEMGGEEFENFKKHPDIYDSWWDYLCGHKKRTIKKKEQEIMPINYKEEEEKDNNKIFGKNIDTNIYRKKIVHSNDKMYKSNLIKEDNEEDGDSQTNNFKQLKVDNNITLNINGELSNKSQEGNNINKNIEIHDSQKDSNISEIIKENINNDTINNKDQDNQKAFINLEVDNEIGTFSIAGETGQALMERFLEKIPEDIKIDDKMDFKKIYKIIMNTKLKEFLDFLIENYLVNKKDDILSFITNILTSLDPDELTGFLMNNENIKKVVLNIMKNSQDNDVAALRETLKEEAIKIINVKDFLQEKDLEEKIEVLSFLLRIDGIFEDANKNGGKVDEWFISLLKYYQDKDLPKDSIPLIIGLFSKMKAEYIGANIDKLTVFFNKITEVYDNLGNNGKKEIVTFAINILDKISKPIKQDNIENNSNNEVDNTYDLLLKFIIDKLKEGDGLLNDVLDNKEVFNLVLNNNGICLKILPLIIQRYEPKDIIPYLIPKQQSNPEKGKQNEEIDTDKGKQFLIAFLEKYGDSMTLEEWSKLNNIDLVLQALLQTYINQKKQLPQPIWKTIFSIAEQQEDDENISISGSNSMNVIKQKKPKLSPDLINLIAIYINKMSEVEINQLVQNTDQEKLITLLLAIFNDIDNDKKHKKYDKNVCDGIFEKIVNENNIEVFIKKILSKNGLQQEILNNEYLKKLFLQQIIQQPDIIIQHFLKVDDEEEIKEDEKQENLENKEQKVQKFLNFFLSLWKGGIKTQLLQTGDIEIFLTTILTHVKENMPGQEQLDILWKILKYSILKENDMANMHQSFWDLVYQVIDQVCKKGKIIPVGLLKRINNYTKNNQNNKKNKTNDNNNKNGTTNSYNLQTLMVDDTSKNNSEMIFDKDDDMVIDEQTARRIKFSSSHAIPITVKPRKTEYCKKISDQAYTNMKYGAYGGNVKKGIVTINSGDENNMLLSTTWKVDTKIAKKDTINNGPNNNVGTTNKQSSYEHTEKEMNNYKTNLSQQSMEKQNKNIKNGHNDH